MLRNFFSLGDPIFPGAFATHSEHPPWTAGGPTPLHLSLYRKVLLSYIIKKAANTAFLTKKFILFYEQKAYLMPLRLYVNFFYTSCKLFLHFVNTSYTIFYVDSPYLLKMYAISLSWLQLFYSSQIL